MSEVTSGVEVKRSPWWKSIGPALITACVVFGPGSLLISSNVGAKYGYELLWLLVLTGLLMGTYLTMGARIGVCGGATPCTLLAERLGRPAAFVIGLTLCLICSAFQFSNNMAVALAAGAFLPESAKGISWLVPAIVVGFNLLVIVFLFAASHVYRVLERVMKVMVGVILACFLFNLFMAKPNWLGVVGGFVPSIPEGIELGLPQRAGGAIRDPMILVAGLLGTTFSVAGAFFQGNLVRERNWTISDYFGSIGDAIAGVCVLTGVSMIIMMTTATVIPGQAADNIGTLAQSLRPLLGTTAYWVFCIGLVAVAMNPFVINAVIGGTILADGLGLPARMNDRWPRILTIAVMLLGMIVALYGVATGEKPINLIIFGQALTVLGNPLMAIAMLWLANQKDIMGRYRNGPVVNTLAAIGLLAVVLMAIRVALRIVLQLT
ncbi:MAG: divalent metal cation transporter [Planctomycetes bacterium]|nr:divalent metal cation transporter [Planctomycetota bacterium]